MCGFRTKFTKKLENTNTLQNILSLSNEGIKLKVTLNYPR